MKIRIIIIFAMVLVQNSLAAKISIDDFLQKDHLYSMAISPDDKHLASIQNVNGERAVIITNLEKNQIVGTLYHSHVKPESLLWINSERLIVGLRSSKNLLKLLKKEARGEKVDFDEYSTELGYVSIDVTAKDEVILMKGRKGKWGYYGYRSKIENLLIHDKEHILMSARGGEKLYRVNIYTGDVIVYEVGGSSTFSIFTDINGVPKYRLDYLYLYDQIEILAADKNTSWHVVDKLNREKEEDEQAGHEEFSNFFLDSDGTLVYLKPSKESGFVELVKYDHQSKTLEQFATHDGADIVDAITDGKNRKIIGYRYQKDYVRDVYFDNEKQKAYDKMVEMFGDYNIRIYVDNEESNLAIIKTARQDDPGTFYLYNFKTEKLSFIGYRNQAKNSESLSIPGTVTYKARDGQKIRMYVLFPEKMDKGKPNPLVILPHGGPQSRTTSYYNDLAQFISTRGYIVVQPNFRGSTGYGKPFEEAGYQQWGQLMQDDLTDAVNFMIARKYTSRDKVCIVGASYGGYAALMGAIKTPDLFQCAISINGVTDLEDMIDHHVSYRYQMTELYREHTNERVGNPETQEKMLIENSPVFNSNKINIPVLLIASEHDGVVPVRQSEAMAESLKSAEKEFEFIKFEKGGHNLFERYDNKQKSYKAIAKFLKLNLSESVSESNDSIKN